MANSKPYNTQGCPVCVAAKRNGDDTITDQMIHNHWVKEKPGSNVVVCPTLLKQACRYCKEAGHTPKYCPKLQAKVESKTHIYKPQDDDWSVASGKRLAKTSNFTFSEQQPSHLNKFEVFRPQMDAVEANIEELKHYPGLGCVTRTKPHLKGWAAMAAKPAPRSPSISPPPTDEELSDTHFIPVQTHRGGPQTWIGVDSDSEDDSMRGYSLTGNSRNNGFGPWADNCGCEEDS